MTYFTDDEIENHWEIWQVFRDGGIALFYDRSWFAEFLDELTSNKYEILTCNCNVEKEDDLLTQLGRLLKFDNPYSNLDSFNDKITDVEISDIEGGIVLVLEQFDPYFERYSTYAKSILDIFAETHRYNLLFGRRFLVLIKTENPHLQLPSVGAILPNWNHKEFFLKNRLKEEL